MPDLRRIFRETVAAVSDTEVVMGEWAAMLVSSDAVLAIPTENYPIAGYDATTAQRAADACKRWAEHNGA